MFLESLARLRRFLPQEMPGVSPSFNLCSIRLSASAWCLLVFSCSCCSLSFCAARSRLLRMSSSNRTTQSLDITECTWLISSSIVQFTRVYKNNINTISKSSEEEKTFRSGLKSNESKGQRSLNEDEEFLCAFFYKCLASLWL